MVRKLCVRYEHFTDLVLPSHHDGAQEVGGRAVLVGNDELHVDQNTSAHAYNWATDILSQGS